MYLKHRREMENSGLHIGMLQLRCFIQLVLCRCRFVRSGSKFIIISYLCGKFSVICSGEMFNFFLFIYFFIHLINSSTFCVLQSTWMVWNPKSRSTTRCMRTFRTVCSTVYRWEGKKTLWNICYSGMITHFLFVFCCWRDEKSCT